MRLVTSVAFASWFLSALSASSAAQQAATPQSVFRAGIELVSVDVTALDTNGRQVTDLAATDFVVEVDGDQRQGGSAGDIRSGDRARGKGRRRRPTRPSSPPMPRAHRAGGWCCC